MSGLSHGEGAAIRRTIRPPSVTFAASLQLLFAAGFVIAPIVVDFVRGSWADSSGGGGRKRGFLA